MMEPYDDWYYTGGDGLQKGGFLTPEAAQALQNQLLGKPKPKKFPTELDKHFWSTVEHSGCLSRSELEINPWYFSKTPIV